YVRKRDGRVVPFDKQKIADAIFKAAQSVGGQDRYLAEDLAEVVRIYLEKKYKGDIPSVEEIQDIVERVLIKTGHAKTAKAYILYRQRRARARQIREGKRPEDLSEIEVLKGIVKRDISVRRSDDRIGVWDKTAIVEALVRETGISRNIAEIIVAEVEEDVVASKIKNLTSSMIRELVNAKLVLYGFEGERLKHSRIGIPFYDISSIFESFNGPPDMLSGYLGRRIKREFAINAVIPQAIVEKHLKGEISIESIEGIDKILTAYIPVNTLNEISHLYKNIYSLVDGDVVFSLPNDISSFDKALFNENPFVLEFPYRLIKDKVIETTKNYIVKIDDKDTFEAFMKAGEKRDYFISLHRKVKGPLLVLNRIALNIPVIQAYAEQDNVPLKIRLSEILKALFDMVVSQETLIKKTPYGRDVLSLFTEYSPTVEIEYVETEKDGWTPDEEFFSEILSSSLSVFIKHPSDYMIDMAGRCFEKDGVIARIKNG
ncbi:MAG: ATP cone domain-containing protein, partial [Candidatus Omnitrophica bacterium]|nr:ATP cone domain-containing protein [Candidatus Omnitrophota bacterium]